MRSFRQLGFADLSTTGYFVAFTGHRPEKLGGYRVQNSFRDRLMMRLEHRLIVFGTEHPDLVCISGMALGFDQWAAAVCIRLGIPFVAAVPFKDHEAGWSPTAQEHYRMLLSRAREVHIICDGGYAPEKFQFRNEWMVDHCEYVIAAWDRGRGGTANCLRYATSLKRPWENLLEGL